MKHLLMGSCSMPLEFVSAFFNWAQKPKHDYDWVATWGPIGLYLFCLGDMTIFHGSNRGVGQDNLSAWRNGSPCRIDQYLGPPSTSLVGVPIVIHPSWSKNYPMFLKGWYVHTSLMHLYCISIWKQNYFVPSHWRRISILCHTLDQVKQDFKRKDSGFYLSMVDKFILFSKHITSLCW